MFESFLSDRRKVYTMKKLTFVYVIGAILTFIIAIHDYTHGSSDGGLVFVILGVICLGLMLSSMKK